jgi:hypothetical protein
MRSEQELICDRVLRRLSDTVEQIIRAERSLEQALDLLATLYWHALTQEPEREPADLPVVPALDQAEVVQPNLSHFRGVMR